ncbi:MAG: phosphodiester glycosidase family protein [Rhodobacteraceae bacterium]|nr:phosphodiester glycosidase family protein [Paracoccaceae bacterium]
MTTLWASLLAVLATGGTALAGACRDAVFEEVPYTVCEAAAGEDLRLYLDDAEGALLGTFERLSSLVARDGRQVVFAMNAGMYHPDRRPVGLYVEDGAEASRLVTAAGPGNFGLVPNGVFCIRPEGFAVIETRGYRAAAPACRFATQSGPMLVIDGALHPRFLAGSGSRYIRNGVGVSADGLRAFFVISNAPVNFHAFARFFRDVLRTPDALYFDGNISRLYAPELHREDFGFPMGPIVALTSPSG